MNMYLHALWISIWVVCVDGGLLSSRQSSPIATLEDGSVIVGTSDQGVDSFKGIPFALPPVTALRLRPPHPLTSPLGTFMANKQPPSCPQPSFSTVSEDCLYLNVFKPSSATASSKLPVIAYIYGGGFIGGDNSALDGPFFVRQSQAKALPYLVVAMNYRVGAFGFLSGKEIAAEGSTNLGLRDQRAALQWIQQNIGSFGGDPDKVTLWGHSAGAISVMDHTIINRGNHTFNGKALFRGAMMNSGTIFPAQEVDSPRAQALFDKVTETTGCATAADKVACLRNVPFNDFLQATVLAPGLLGYTSIDFTYFPRPDNRSDFFPQSPELAIIGGQYARVPVIAGDMEDEGTLFVQQANIQTNDELITLLQRHWAGTSRDDIPALLAAYPDDPGEGSPFRTGTANNIYPQYKRLAAIHGDTTFTLITRAYLSIVSGAVDAYSYIGTFLYGSGASGTPHSTDYSASILPNPGTIVPRDSVNTYYTSFVNFGAPNAIQSQWPTWPKYTPGYQVLLNYSISEVTLVPSVFRAAQYQAFIGRLAAFRF